MNFTGKQWMPDFAIFITSLRTEEMGLRSLSQKFGSGRLLNVGLNRFLTLQKSKAACKVQGKINIFKEFQHI